MASIFFWVIILIAFVLWGWWGWSRPAGERPAAGIPFLILALIILLGLKVFPFTW